MAPRTRSRRTPPPTRRRTGPGHVHRPKGRRTWLWRYRRLLFLVGLLLFTAVAGAAYLMIRVPLPPEKVPDQTTYLYDAKGIRVASIDAGQTRESVTLDRVPQVLVDAVIATEDKNFFDHSGIDPVSVVRATVNDLRNRSALQGGSTITQQYVKNTYVGRERTIWRKLREAVLAVKLERKLDKPEILERYLNTIYLGRGAAGVQAAARAYFGRDVEDVGLKEAAYLAGLIRAPELADALRHPDVARARRSRTLEAMRREGMIEDSDVAEVEAIPLDAYVLQQRSAAPRVVGKGTQYFVDYVRKQLEDEFGSAAVLTGGLKVKTTLDLRLQAEAYDAVYGVLNRADDPAGALVAVDDQGQIKAMVGGRDWNQNKVNLAVGAAGGGSGRQAGSTFKPFALAEMVREGYTVQSALPGPAELVLPRANNGKDWPVENYEEQDFGGAVSLLDATRNSVNTVYAQLAVTLGASNIKSMAADLGVRSPLPAVNSLVLGTASVSVLDVAGAFSTFANRGEQVEPRAILEVRGPDNRILKPMTRPARRRVLERKDVDVVNFALRQVVERGTGTGARFGPAGSLAGKTGTTDNYGDAWFVGYTPKLTAAVWMGYPEASTHTMTNVRGRKVSGGTYPATIFKRFMAQAVRGADHGTFPTVTTFPGKLLKGARLGSPPSSSTTVGISTSVPRVTTTTVATGQATTSTFPNNGSIYYHYPSTTERPKKNKGTTTTEPPPPPPPEM